MKKLIAATALAGYLTLANSCSYINTGIMKSLGTSQKEAAVRALMNETPIVNTIGYRLAHEHFYGDSDYREVALRDKPSDLEAKK